MSGYHKALPALIAKNDDYKLVPGAALIHFSNTTFSIASLTPFMIRLEDISGELDLHPLNIPYIIERMKYQEINQGDKVHIAILRYHKEENCTTLIDLIKILDTPQKDAAPNLSFAYGFSR